MNLDEAIRKRMADDVDTEAGADGNVIDAAISYQDVIRTVLGRHARLQHYVTGQDNKRRRGRVTCAQCRTTYPCDEVQAIAAVLGIRVDETGE